MNWLPTIVQKQLNLNVSSSSLWMIATNYWDERWNDDLRFNL
jgi:hypothetical protein